MKKKLFVTVLAIVFLLSLSSILIAGGGKKEKAPPAEKKPEEVKKEEPTKKAVKNPDTIIIAKYGTIQSLDPHRAYDTASGEATANLYDTLIAFDRGSTDRFVPLIAEKVPSLENGLIRDGGKTYVFPIRKGVKFHNGAELTPEDVEYSFERALVTDQDGGPIWMFYEPLLGVGSSRDGDGNIVVDFSDIDRAIEVEGQNVVFHLEKPYPPFLAILAQYWSAILNKNWMIDNGAWDGTAANWKKYNNPEQGTETLYNKAMGTGPYMLVKWEPGVELSLVRFENYFRGPAPVKNVVRKVVDEWTTRKLMFTAGDADIITVDPQYWPEMENIPGVKVYKDLRSLSNRAFFFNLNINPEANQDIWSGKLDGQGISPDFFQDKNVRLGFAHCFDWDTYIKDVYHGFAIQPASPIVDGLPFRDPNTPKYSYDLKKAEEYFRKAWGGAVWEKGFKMTIMYNTGNEPREIACQMIEENVESLNPKFQIEVRNVDWGNYLNTMIAQKLTLFIIGWVADFADPHNFVYPFMHSNGDFAKWQSYSNPEVDRLIEEGISTVDPARRKEIYYRLARIYYEDIPSFQVVQPLFREHMRDWITGYIYNPVKEDMLYCYDLKKGY
ncbi:MAG: ABC transporter substrate-binding protein [Spirochaetota bacterium]